MCKHNSTRCYTESECHEVMGSARLGIPNMSILTLIGARLAILWEV